MPRLLVQSLLLSPSALAAPVAHVKLYSNGTEIVQWTDTNGRLSGTYQVVLAGETLQKIASRNATFSGTRQGSTVTLWFSTTVFGSTDTAVWTGTLAGSNLTLNRPLSTGIERVTLTKSTVEAYNAAVAELQAQVDAQTSAVREINAAAAELLRRAQTVWRELTQRAVRDLQSAAALFEQDLAALYIDHQTLLKNAAEAEDCYDVQSVQGYDLSQLTGYDLSQVTGFDTAALERAMADTGGPWPALSSGVRTGAPLPRTPSDSRSSRRCPPNGGRWMLPHWKPQSVTCAQPPRSFESSRPRPWPPGSARWLRPRSGSTTRQLSAGRLVC
ncbi:hypothetical protein, partial [Deinococcus koreensis]